MDEALKMADHIAVLIRLSPKNTFHFRLLAEEMFSMLKAITGEFSADFWIEENNGNCALHLVTKSDLDYGKRHELLSVSTTGENIAPRGIMEKIREIIQAGLYHAEESFELQAQYGAGMFPYGALGMIDDGMSDAVYAWSMQKYKNEVEAERKDNDNPAAEEAWDELEKSIIANIADEIRVGVRKDSAELIVLKKFN